MFNKWFYYSNNLLFIELTKIINNLYVKEIVKLYFLIIIEKINLKYESNYIKDINI